MFQYSNSKLVDFDISKVLKVILDIKNYPKFIRWCSNARIISNTEKEIIADLVISFRGINVKYRSNVIVIDNIKTDGSASVKSIMVKGPFKFLNFCWDLSKIEDKKTEVNFKIDFLLKSSILKKLVTPMFNHASSKIFESFDNYIKSL